LKEAVDSALNFYNQIEKDQYTTEKLLLIRSIPKPARHEIINFNKEGDEDFKELINFEDNVDLDMEMYIRTYEESISESKSFSPETSYEYGDE